MLCTNPGLIPHIKHSILVKIVKIWLRMQFSQSKWCYFVLYTLPLCSERFDSSRRSKVDAKCGCAYFKPCTSDSAAPAFHLLPFYAILTIVLNKEYETWKIPSVNQRPSFWPVNIFFDENIFCVLKMTIMNFYVLFPQCLVIEFNKVKYHLQNLHRVYQYT